MTIGGRRSNLVVNAIYHEIATLTPFARNDSGKRDCDVPAQVANAPEWVLAMTVLLM